MRVKCFQLQTCTVMLQRTHDGHGSRYLQRSLNNQSFWEVDANWRCRRGIKKGPRNHVNPVTQLVHTWYVLDLLTEQEFYGSHVIQSFSTTASVQLLFDCYSLPHRRQLVENAARLRQLRDSRCQTHMTANRPWSCGLLLWLETGPN